MIRTIIFLKDYVDFRANSFVWLYGISTIVGYLIPNPINTYILNIYGL